jgi:hypothetical protein
VGVVVINDEGKTRTQHLLNSDLIWPPQPTSHITQCTQTQDNIHVGYIYRRSPTNNDDDDDDSSPKFLDGSGQRRVHATVMVR